MHRLNTLGTLEITGLPAAEGGAILAQPKRVAVLLYLSLAHPAGWQRRDTLLGLLWGDLDESHARNALSQALHHLRRGLGAESLPGQGPDLVRVEPARLACDAALFEALIRERRHAEALELYRGDLAPGHYLSDAPEFDRWLEGERRRLRDLAFLATTAIAGARESAGDIAGAAETLRRAADLRPEDEATLRRLMQLLDRAGDRPSALRAYEQFASRLRSELEVEPSAETEALARELRTAGARTRPVLASLPAPVPTQVEVVRSAPVEPAAPVGRSTVARTGRGPRRRRLQLAALALLGAVAGVTGGQRLLKGSARPTDPAGSGDRVAIAPFRLSGADPAVAYLREGMVDLLAAKLSGIDGPRALDPRAVLAAWRGATGTERGDLTPEDALLLTSRLGAQRLVLGGVVGRADRLMINASIRTVPAGRELARASVEGPADSLPELVDRLAVQLLLDEAGERSERSAALTSSSLPALQAFVAGRKSYRAARYAEAAEHFRRALEYDSMFALAALQEADATDWIGGPGDDVAKQRAFALRDHLVPADRAYLVAVLGPRWPEVSTPKERLHAWEEAVRLAPDRPEAWFGLGDALHHDGVAMGEPEAVARAREAFERALALDPQYAAPLAHLADRAFVRDDLAAAQSFVTRYLEVDSTGDLAHYLRWRLAAATDDRRALEAMRARFDSVPPIALYRIAVASQLDGVRITDGSLAAQRLLARAATPGEVARAERLLLLLAFNAGRFRMAAQLIPRQSWRPDIALFVAGEFWDGDPGNQAAERTRLARDPVLYARYEVLLGRLWRGEPVPEGEVARLRRELVATREAWIQRALIDLDGIAECRPGAAPSGSGVGVARLDSLTLAGEPSDWFGYRPLLLARCLEWRGDPAGALQVLRRRPYRAWTGLPFLEPSFKEEGRLALAAGDTAGAWVAWRRYLELRSDPDPELAPERDRIRRLFQSLGR
jgi:serine/threonine-protein kinase